VDPAQLTGELGETSEQGEDGGQGTGSHGGTGLYGGGERPGLQETAEEIMRIRGPALQWRVQGAPELYLALKKGKGSPGPVMETKWRFVWV